MSLCSQSATAAHLHAICSSNVASKVLPSFLVTRSLPPHCSAHCHSNSVGLRSSRRKFSLDSGRIHCQWPSNNQISAFNLCYSDPLEVQYLPSHSHSIRNSNRSLLLPRSSSSRPSHGAIKAANSHKDRPITTVAAESVDPTLQYSSCVAQQQTAEVNEAVAQQQQQPQQKKKHMDNTFTTQREASIHSKHKQPSSPMDLFQKGVAISVWQNSSDVASQWTAYMKRKQYFGQQHLVSAFMESNDFWNRYEDDIQLVKALGCNSFRFSFEWSRIEPAPGQIDREAIARYHQMLDCVHAAGLLPNATLHHFTHPQWFESRGGFAKAQNLPAFISYSTLMFQEFGHRIPFWATFNEPSCFCLCGYIMGLWAPGQKGRLVKAGKILGNMLKAHVAVYRKLKAMPHGDVAQVGIVHQHIRFIPHCNWLASLIVRPVCHWMTYWFAARQMLDFFTTGKFVWRAPFIGQVLQFEEPDAVGAIDFWGINYYSRPAISSSFKLVGTGPSEPLTGMGMPLVPGDLYTHCMQAHTELKVPIIVTETGVSDERHVLRARCISSYYTEVLRAIADGCDVRGVYYWTLMDNIEWHHGFNQHFGLYAWRPSANGGNGRPTDGSTLQLREGSKALVELHNAWPERLDHMKLFAQQQLRGVGSSAAAADSGGGSKAAAAAERKGARVNSSMMDSLPGVGQETVEALQAQVVAADAAAGLHDGQRKEIEQPLLGGGGRISDVQ